MNKHSAEIGLSRSNFASVHGLVNKSNISTAKDMAILGMTLM
jgi:D-alanyl-D-alanine carboxypeptidase